MAVLQIVRFRVKDEEEFRAVNERFQQEVAPTLPGLIRREATHGVDGEWLLVLRYSDIETATKTGKNDTSEVAKSLMSFIDMSTMSSAFFDIISE